MSKDMESRKTEITDISGEEFSKFTLPCLPILLLGIVLAIVDMYFIISFPTSAIGPLLSAIIIAIFILYYYYVASKSLGKLRKFSISDDEIEIIVPNEPYFTIKWDEFDKIEVKLNEIDLRPYIVYHIHFIHQKIERTVKLSLDDFHKEKLKEILRELKKHALLNNKNFSAVKESFISGVYIVEELEIQ
jgi:hypothetical protein